MGNDTPVRFTLNDNTIVIVKQVANNTYDFELIFANGSRKTFLWTNGTSTNFKNRKGDADASANEAVKKFYAQVK